MGFKTIQLKKSKKRSKRKKEILSLKIPLTPGINDCFFQDIDPDKFNCYHTHRIYEICPRFACRLYNWHPLDCFWYSMSGND